MVSRTVNNNDNDDEDDDNELDMDDDEFDDDGKNVKTSYNDGYSYNS